MPEKAQHHGEGLCTSHFQNLPPPLGNPRTIPGNLTRVKLSTVGNLTLDFRVKTSVSGTDVVG